MKTKKKAKRILKAVDRAYTVPAYMEERVLTSIEAELRNIEEEEKKDGE